MTCSDGDGPKHRGCETPTRCGLGVAAGGGGGGDGTPPAQMTTLRPLPTLAEKEPQSMAKWRPTPGTTLSTGGARVEDHRVGDLQAEDPGAPCRRTRGAGSRTSAKGSAS